MSQTCFSKLEFTVTNKWLKQIFIRKFISILYIAKDSLYTNYTSYPFMAHPPICIMHDAAMHSADRRIFQVYLSVIDIWILNAITIPLRNKLLIDLMTIC